MLIHEYRWEQLQLGTSAQFEVVLTSEMMAAFAALSGDRNPLHMDDGFAKNAGYTDCVVFGMLTASFYSTLVGMYLPGKYALLHGVEAYFHAPSYVGDTLMVSGAVSFLNEAYRRLELKAKIVNQNGVLISKAKIRVGLHES